MQCEDSAELRLHFGILSQSRDWNFSLISSPALWLTVDSNNVTPSYQNFTMYTCLQGHRLFSVNCNFFILLLIQLDKRWILQLFFVINFSFKVKNQANCVCQSLSRSYFGVQGTLFCSHTILHFKWIWHEHYYLSYFGYICVINSRELKKKSHFETGTF